MWPGHGAARGPGSALSAARGQLLPGSHSHAPRLCEGKSRLVTVALSKSEARWPVGSREPPSLRAPAALYLLCPQSCLQSERVPPRLAGQSLRSSSLTQQHRPKPGDVRGHRPPPNGFDPGLAARDSWRVWGSEGQEAASLPEARAADTSGWPWVRPARHTRLGRSSRTGQGGHVSRCGCGVNGDRSV